MRGAKVARDGAQKCGYSKNTRQYMLRAKVELTAHKKHVQYNFQDGWFPWIYYCLGS